jgi:hypothetical protein
MSNETRTLVSPCTLGVVACLALHALSPNAARAQFFSAIDLSSRSARPTAGEWQSQLAVSPFARFDHPRVTVDGRWTAFGGNGEKLDGIGNLSATFFSPARAGLQLSVAGFADRAMLSETFPVSRFGTDARLSYRHGSAGAWLGREISRDNKSTPLSAVPRVSGGAWRQWGSTVLTVSMASFGSREGRRTASTYTETRPTLKPAAALDTGQKRTLDTVVVNDSGSTGTQRDWSDAQVALHWSAGRLAFRGVVGTRLFMSNLPNDTWGEVQGTLALAPDIALIAASGVHPASAVYGLSRGRFLELGLRVAPSALRKPRLPASVRPVAAAFEVAEGDHGQRTLRIRVPYARSVELSGDFTDWKPISLTRGDDDRWETTLPIAPGIHRLAIRVNGDAWTPPPGVSSVPDEFQGNVGVIVVK